MGNLKKILKNEKIIIECFIVSMVCGWVIAAYLNGSFKHMQELNFVTENRFLVTLLLTLAFAGLTTLFYRYKPMYVRVEMFLLVLSYMITVSYKANSIYWSVYGKNSMGLTTYAVMTGLITVLAFWYVKEDLFHILKKGEINNKTMYIIVAIIGLITFAIVAVGAVYRYKTYSNSTFDFGIFAQMYEYMKQKGTMQTTVERSMLLSHFSVHFSPIFYIGLPLYWLFSSPVTVQVIQAIMVALPVIPIVLLCRKYNISNKITILLTLVYVLYPASTTGTFYDIHENCFLTFMVLMLIWAVERKQNIITVIFLLLTLMVKEDAAIYVIILGLFWLLSRKDKKRGIILMVAGCVYFVVAVSIVNSYGLGVLDDRFYNLYFDAEGGMFQIIQTTLTNPAYVLGQIVSNSQEGGMDKIEYLIQMFVPIALLLFNTSKKYSRYILLVPIIVINIFTTYLYFHDIGFQYNFGIVALFMYMIIMNVSDMKYEKRNNVVCITVIMCLMMFVGLALPNAPKYWKRYKENKVQYEKIDSAIDLIPKDASVTSSGFFMPHVSDHLVVFDPRYVDVQIETEYILLDMRSDEDYQIVASEIESGKYEQIYSEANLVSIYKRID